MSIQSQILPALDGIFSSNQSLSEDVPKLAYIKREIARLSGDDKKSFAEYLLSTPLPQDNLIGLYIYLFDCFQDARFLEKSLECLPARLTVPAFYEVYWNFTQQLFSSTSGSKMVVDALRDLFEKTADSLKQFLETRGIMKRNYPLAEPRKIAILSPQILTMRHSPTREAFSLSLHLEKYHGCECYIINTNAMHYKGINTLNTVSPPEFNVNQSLNGGQKVQVNYMDFESDVSIFSFPPGAMTTQKVASIVDTINQLGCDAVISHGDNLMVMESLYRYLPSLFATTGAVVPFNHCDAYFVPKDLFDDAAKAVAQKYKHDNFMLESMLVTPEGVSETPANRADFSLEESDYVYLIVGTRLHKEVNREFAEICQQLLDKVPNGRILLAGTPEMLISEVFDQAYIDEKRVQNIGFQNDLPAICAMSDCYLNPARAGGGTSSQTAIINGMAVVTLDKGHISAIVPESKHCSDWNDYIDYAARLAREPSLQASEAVQLKQHYYENLDAKSQVDSIYKMLCHVASDEFVFEHME